jgi:aminoglycoside 2'-N-acetyltransferase I
MSLLRLTIVESAALSRHHYDEVLHLCNAAYAEDLAELMATFGASTHVLGTLGPTIVSHAMWVTRWLQPDGSRPLMTAYVEAVATLPAYQGNGYATQVMQHLAERIPACYETAALSPANTSIYRRLGWQLWRGPLSIRLTSGGYAPTPDDTVMVLQLPGRKQLDLNQALSAEWREGELW